MIPEGREDVTPWLPHTYRVDSHMIVGDDLHFSGGDIIRETTDRQRRVVRSIADGTWRLIRRVFVGVVGLVVLTIGIVMIVTPGPAILVIPAGLAILGTEFHWARRHVDRIRSEARRRFE